MALFLAQIFNWIFYSAGVIFAVCDLCTRDD